MAAPAVRPFASRLRNLVAFVAIVWGVATTFVAFEIVSLSGVDLALLSRPFRRYRVVSNGHIVDLM